MLAAIRKGAFVDMAALAFVRCAAVLGLATAGVAAQAAEADQHPPPAKPVCLNATETREEIKTHKLLEPFAALKSASQQRKAEALSAKLCHNGDEFVYEITLLHRDGRLVHVEMEAATGKLIPRPPRETHDTHDAHDTHDVHDTHEPPVKN
jgi:uncharacterized membrane protein YkoI